MADGNEQDVKQAQAFSSARNFKPLKHLLRFDFGSYLLADEPLILLMSAEKNINYLLKVTILINKTQERGVFERTEALEAMQHQDLLKQYPCEVRHLLSQVTVHKMRRKDKGKDWADILHSLDQGKYRRQ